MKKDKLLQEEIKRKRPLVHCITNIVTVNDCANALLAIGASPTMAHHPLEVEEIASHSQAVVLNMGAMECYEAMILAGMAAKKAGVVVVLDPVGAAGAAYRRAQTKELIQKVQPDCIRGNHSEIRALVTDTSVIMGVDAAREEEIQLEQIKAYSKKHQVMVISSGATNYIIQGEEVYCCPGGSAYMARVTGTGCMSSALIGAYLSVDKSAKGALACMEFIGACGQEAERKTNACQGGTMTFRNLLIDEMSK